MNSAPRNVQIAQQIFNATFVALVVIGFLDKRGSYLSKYNFTILGYAVDLERTANFAMLLFGLACFSCAVFVLWWVFVERRKPASDGAGDNSSG